MVDRIPRVTPGAKPVGQPSPIRERQVAPGMDFRGVLAEQLGAGQIKFSAHAQARIAARQIQLGGNDLAKLKGAVDRAAAKGARESLILMDDKAFVVSVRNRTVITAVDGESIRENVFTNIDSAVIV